MINLWYNYDEVTGFHPVVEVAVKNAITNCGYDSVFELVHHPAIPNSTIIPDFAIKLRASNRYVFVIEVKKTARDVISQRFQNQCRSYVTDFSPYWEPNFPKYFCLTNIEELILFADRQGPISTCILKGNPKSHSRFDAKTRDATLTSVEFQKSFEQILPMIYNRIKPEWDNNWKPIIDSFDQNFKSVSGKLSFNKELSDELSLYEFFRLLAFTYLKDYYNQTKNPNQSYFKGFPTDKDNLQSFKTKLSNNYDRVLQLDFNQVFSNHPNSTIRIFPENFDSSILQYFKNIIKALNDFGSQAVSDNPLPEYIFNLLTSKVYDKETLNKKGKIMSDTELSILLATLTIEDETSLILDPCSGDGALLDASYDYLNLLSLSKGIFKTHNELLEQTSGIEIDPFLAQLATFRLIAKNLSGVNSQTTANIVTGNTFVNPKSSSYDVILMNPPFLRNDNPKAPIPAVDKALMNIAITKNGQLNFVELASQPNLYFYFVNYVWHYLNDHGKAGFILMAKFLNNEDGKYLKRFILDKVEAIILYPRNYFSDFKVTTVITVLNKETTNDIKFLRILSEDLLSRPEEIKSILNSNSISINTSEYTLKVVDRNIDPSDNWKMYLIDPEDKFGKLNSLSFVEPLDTFFTIKKRGNAENNGGSTIIFPNFNNFPYSTISKNNIGYGVKNSKSIRKLILDKNNLEEEKAIHFPDRYDDTSSNGLSIINQSDSGLNTVFDNNNSADAKTWRKIVNNAFSNKVTFDILIPRAERTKHSCYYNPFSSFPVVLTTNFFYLSGLKNENTNAIISKESQLKFITAYLNSCFGQIQFEIHSNNQEGMRKLEGFHINELKVLDLRLLSKVEVDSVVSEFEAFSALNIAISGGEGLLTPRRKLDEEIAKIIYNRDNLGFSSNIQLTDFFELFLADLVEDRKL
ncbi:BpuSI family type II restriction endonuclease [Flavobacterium tructae]|uniref:BpuSI family type II restriction endonuclease n=1 Tax=Flavobacterium tructae TaxID=1114873 RepID=UPI0035A8EA31